ncbi:MAG TPA: succinate dehydrogenase, hydrophobic membrane anchor protein [Steroidobacteraceae bacterium]|nr:succinate dehydrogenase, hydrophobic membrane anchor protein [Steroidobacteraceae bacterium]
MNEEGRTPEDEGRTLEERFDERSSRTPGRQLESWRSPLGRVRGQGSAKEGVAHWWVQRLTSVALIPLGCWFVVSLLALPALDYATVSDWMGNAWTAVLMILFVLVTARHSQLGVQVIIEDYVHESGMKTLSLALSSFAHVLFAAAGVLAVLRITLRSVS